MKRPKARPKSEIYTPKRDDEHPPSVNAKIQKLIAKHEFECFEKRKGEDGLSPALFIWESPPGDLTSHLRVSQTVLDSGYHVMDSGFEEVNPNSSSMELGFRIPIVGGIPDSLSCIWIPKPRIPDSTSQNFPNSGSRFP